MNNWYFNNEEAGLIPPLQRNVTVISAAQVATMFTVPVTVISGITGKIIIPEYFHIEKEAGSAWTLGSSGVLTLELDATPFTNHAALFDQGTTNTFFGAVKAIWQGSTGNTALGLTTGTHATSGAGARMLFASADPSTPGTGNLIVTLYYRVWPGL